MSGRGKMGDVGESRSDTSEQGDRDSSAKSVWVVFVLLVSDPTPDVASGKTGKVGDCVRIGDWVPTTQSKVDPDLFNSDSMSLF